MIEGLEALAAPVMGDKPAGADLRQDYAPTSIYYRLRDARAEARALERSSDAAQDADAVQPPEWRKVRQLATGALAASKDLEIAAWLTEAMLRVEGLEGFAAGTSLMASFVRDFWENGLYPVADEDGIATRVAPVTGLNGQGSDGVLIQPLRKSVLFRTPDGRAVTFWEYAASRGLAGEADAKKRAQRMAAGVRAFEDTERDAKSVPQAAWAAMARTVRAAQDAWTALETAFEAACGRDGPPTGRVRALLEDMAAAVTLYAPPEAAAAADAEAAEEVTGQPAAAAFGPVQARPAETREDMLRDLARIANFFRRTEPHSPLAYTLDDAVRRARLTWPELLAEIVPDAGARAQMLLQLGIKPAAP